MDVVGVILRVVILGQEAGRLDAVIVRLASFNATGPGKMDAANPALLYFVHFNFGQLFGHTMNVIPNQRQQDLLLTGSHGAGGNAFGSGRVADRLQICRGDATFTGQIRHGAEIRRDRQSVINARRLGR